MGIALSCGFEQIVTMDGMKQIATSGLLTLCLVLAGCGEPVAPNADDLPWHISTAPSGNSVVFQLELGVATLKDAINRLRSFPEMAVFAHENGKRKLEAYFGTQRLGLFEGKFIVELQADNAQLDAFQGGATKREGMASGFWKYTLAEEHVTMANALPIRQLVYIPMINYEPEIVQQRFGTPSERSPTGKTGVEYWFYPDKGLAILMNADGGEILYYVPKAGFTALRQALLESKPDA